MGEAAVTPAKRARDGPRRLRILVPLAALWLLAGAYLHGVWAPRAASEIEATAHAETSDALRSLEATVISPVRRAAMLDLAPVLEAALAAQPWSWVEVRDRAGQSLRRESPRYSGSAGPAVEHPLTEGALVIGWFSAAPNTAPLLDKLNAQLRELDLILLAGMVATLLLGNLLLLRVVRRPLERLAASAAVLQGDRTSGTTQDDDIIDQLGEDLARAAAASRGREQALSSASEARQQAEDLLHESQERYMLAVRGVEDGLWEWDLRHDRMFYSPRWKSMLGCAEDEVGDRLFEWLERIHPEDYDAVNAALQAHVEGVVPRFRQVHRLRHRDGRYRWVVSRATALRSANGKAYRVIGLLTDISSRKRTDELLVSLAEGLATARGEHFFTALVCNFSRALGVDLAFIAECVDFPTTRVRQLACWREEGFIPPKEFDLADTPCNQTVSDGKLCVIESGVQALYAKEKGWESYIGIPIVDSADRVIGHLACYHSRPIDQELPVKAIFSLFALRAGVELEREHWRRDARLSGRASP